MKIWLNDLKEGDEFYHIIFNDVYKCRHLGNANNIHFKMSRIKFEIINNDNLLANEHEAFVNQYVYDDYESALDALKEKLQKDLDFTLKSIAMYQNGLDDLLEEANELKKLISKYNKNEISG